MVVDRFFITCALVIDLFSIIRETVSEIVSFDASQTWEIGKSRSGRKIVDINVIRFI